ncbi:UNVERIFIED_CONTAM: Retrovirus-related Pol polyprotein from transposon RE2 [Sesamum angustifolium]|uniref:Retrovirus-related Pol polyprotein from transposon RE2 n=1 Tax=Sesamum angustifolium TaxID=2727405 RepID=A0AAW2KXE1_9LAMI
MLFSLLGNKLITLVMTWLLNSIEEFVSANVMFLTTTKAMWDALHDMYSHEKNISRTRKAQWEDFLVAKFLSGLDNNLTVARDHLLASDSVPTLSNALARVLRVATGSFNSISSSGTTTESSAMAVRGRTRSFSRGRGGRGRASITSTNSRYCTHCGRTNHVVDKYWIKHGKPEWVNTVTNGGEPVALEPSPNPSESVTLSREEYEQLLHHLLLTLLPHPHLPLRVLLLRLTDLQTRRTIGGGHERGGLYILNTSPPIDARALSASVSPLQWHCCLGHPSLPTLQKVLPIKSSRLACESCELGKHHRASFPPRVDKCSSSPFTLVHCDIWGPCRFESISGFRYFITFVDDYSRMIWVYLLKDRSQVPTIITSFYNEIKTQFSVNIRILRTDNALEFVQKTVSDFCDSKGILHQTSCPYTSQQNGVAERKHRHLLDVARIIMMHMHVPKSYWGDAILTACYLINRMPSSVLNGDTPYSFLFPDTPLFEVTPRVFGCLCFVHLHSPTLDKLSPRSVKCIFLGSLTCPQLIYSPAYRNVYPCILVVNAPPIPTYPLQVYSRRKRSTNTTLTALPGLPPIAAPGYPSITPIDDLPIALRKVWKMAMDDEMSALISRGTWELVEVQSSSRCKGLHSDIWVNLNWTLYQMDIKNAFLYGDLNETIYMEQPPGYLAQREKQRMVCKLKKAIYGFKQSPRAWFDKFSRIIVYVDDILITGSDLVGIEEAKTYLQKHFVTKDLGRPRYFLGIEIAHSKHGISLSQRKYACDLLHEAGLLGTKPVDTPMDSNPDFWNDDDNYLEDKTKYRRLVGKLIYLTMTRPDISFAVGLVSQFMDKPRSVHWEVALRILKLCWAKDDRKSTSGYCTYVGGNLVTWRSKKQTTVARSSAEAEYRAMAHTTSEILWLKNLLKELGFMYDDPVPMHCDNQAAIHIDSNPIFHERTKHIEVDCHFVREAVMSQKICIPFTPSSKQRADIFTKTLGGKPFDVLCNKLGMIDIFAPA